MCVCVCIYIYSHDREESVTLCPPIRLHEVRSLTLQVKIEDFNGLLENRKRWCHIRNVLNAIKGVKV